MNESIDVFESKIARTSLVLAMRELFWEHKIRTNHLTHHLTFWVGDVLWVLKDVSTIKGSVEVEAYAAVDEDFILRARGLKDTLKLVKWLINQVEVNHRHLEAA